MRRTSAETAMGRRTKDLLTQPIPLNAGDVARDVGDETLLLLFGEHLVPKSSGLLEVLIGDLGGEDDGTCQDILSRLVF